MDYNRILKGILDIGEAMINSGAEILRVEDSMYRLCRSYGFQKVNCWVISSNIQATVETPEGDIITQIRHVPGGEMNFDRLDYLNNLSRKACAETPDAPELRARLEEVLNRPKQPRLMHYIAGVMGGAGFAVFFNCDISDSIVAVFVAGYSQIMARVNKAPATIFLTTSVFPLVPGPNLYYMMYAIVMEDPANAKSEALTLVITCPGIVFGFLIVEIINKYTQLIFKRFRQEKTR